MSREYLVLIVDEPPEGRDIDSDDAAKAEVFMRFTEEPSDAYLERLARANPGKRIYSLMGASTWHSSP